LFGDRIGGRSTEAAARIDGRNGLAKQEFMPTAINCHGAREYARCEHSLQ
jgi:hypothetical protein